MTCTRSYTYLFNGELLPCHVSHFSDGLNVSLQTHLKTLGEGQRRLGLHHHSELVRELLPVPEMRGGGGGEGGVMQICTIHWLVCIDRFMIMQLEVV